MFGPVLRPREYVLRRMGAPASSGPTDLAYPLVEPRNGTLRSASTEARPLPPRQGFWSGNDYLIPPLPRESPLVLPSCGKAVGEKAGSLRCRGTGVESAPARRDRIGRGVLYRRSDSISKARLTWYQALALGCRPWRLFAAQAAVMWRAVRSYLVLDVARSGVCCRRRRVDQLMCYSALNPPVPSVYSVGLPFPGLLRRSPQV